MLQQMHAGTLVRTKQRHIDIYSVRVHTHTHTHIHTRTHTHARMHACTHTTHMHTHTRTRTHTHTRAHMHNTGMCLQLCGVPYGVELRWVLGSVRASPLWPGLRQMLLRGVRNTQSLPSAGGVTVSTDGSRAQAAESARALTRVGAGGAAAGIGAGIAGGAGIATGGREMGLGWEVACMALLPLLSAKMPETPPGMLRALTPCCLPSLLD